MSLRRILKLLLAFVTAQGVTILTQLLVPPLFLHRFTDGLAVYGEWITLSAAVSYLGSINYGIQTYAVNQMTIHRNRGELEECSVVQASALRLFQWIVLALLPVAAIMVFLPVARWLHLRHVTDRGGGTVMALLLLQLLALMIFSLLGNSFMAVSRAHRGANWTNALRLISTAVLGILVWERASFAALAGSQVAVTLGFIVLVLFDLKREAPELVPELHLARRSVIRGMLKPSWHFTVLSLSSFLTWQAPILLMQRLLGPAAVAVFALTRTVFTMSRQALAVASLSIGPEITSLVGRKSWAQLRRLYDLSERVVLFLVPTVSVATLLASPWLLAVWLHKRSLYEPGLCILMALTSAAMGIKEHKYQFQSASNQHTDLSHVLIVSYSAVLLLSIFTMRYFGVVGFMWVWLAAEIAQIVVIFRMNKVLFPSDYSVTAGPLWKLILVLTIVFAGATYPARLSAGESLAKVVAVAAIYTAATAILSYWAFGLSHVMQMLRGRWERRLAGESAVS
jgi:O-antigen/teichoic acid export membrane protein